MATNEEITKRILDAIYAKIGTKESSTNTLRCPICGRNAWSLGQLYIVLSLSSYPNQTILGGRYYPLVAIVCDNCGNTHLLNLFILGFKESDFDSLKRG